MSAHRKLQLVWVIKGAGCVAVRIQAMWMSRTKMDTGDKCVACAGTQQLAGEQKVLNGVRVLWAMRTAQLFWEVKYTVQMQCLQGITGRKRHLAAFMVSYVGCPESVRQSQVILRVMLTFTRLKNTCMHTDACSVAASEDAKNAFGYLTQCMDQK